MPTSKNWKLLQRQNWRPLSPSSSHVRIRTTVFIQKVEDTESSQPVTIPLYSESLVVFLGNFMGSPRRISSPHVNDWEIRSGGAETAATAENLWGSKGQVFCTLHVLLKIHQKKHNFCVLKVSNDALLNSWKWKRRCQPVTNTAR